MNLQKKSSQNVLQRIFGGLAITFRYSDYLMSPLPTLAAVQAVPTMITTQELVEEMNRLEAEAIINEQLDRSDIQKELEKFGVSADDARMRLASLTDAEVSDIAVQMEEAQYGGITSILVLIILILLIIYLAKKI
ncbi:MAG: PA2779 family protein [Oligoflexales bacterium]|nr:PA2779 family protein [Oligoflexales bacterium]